MPLKCESNNVLIEPSPTYRNMKSFTGYILPETFENMCSEIAKMQVYDDDIWITSFPKSGTTWTQEMVWCICNNLNFDAAKMDLDLRFPFIECSALNVGQKNYNFANSIEFVKKMRRPRFIKTHLPWELLPYEIQSFKKRPKIIHVARNPMDACISFYHQSRFVKSFVGEFVDFCKIILKDKYMWCPYTNNILSYWNKRQEPNILFIKYEEMKRNLNHVIDQVYEFLEIELPNLTDRNKLLHHLSFERMKHNESVKHHTLLQTIKLNNVIILDMVNSERKNANENTTFSFMRKGVSGEYNSEMLPELINLFNIKIFEKLEKQGLYFN